MKLYGIGLQYKEAADIISEKINKLNQEYKRKKDESTRYKLYYYREIRKQLLEQYELCTNYYQKGYYRNAKYSFNEEVRKIKVLSDGVLYTKSGTRRRGRCKDTKVEKQPVESDKRGTYRKATPSDIDVLFRRKKDN